MTIHSFQLRFGDTDLRSRGVLDRRRSQRLLGGLRRPAGTGWGWRTRAFTCCAPSARSCRGPQAPALGPRPFIARGRGAGSPWLRLLLPAPLLPRLRDLLTPASHLLRRRHLLVSASAFTSSTTATPACASSRAAVALRPAVYVAAVRGAAPAVPAAAARPLASCAGGYLLVFYGLGVFNGFGYSWRCSLSAVGAPLAAGRPLGTPSPSCSSSRTPSLLTCRVLVHGRQVQGCQHGHHHRRAPDGLAAMGVLLCPAIIVTDCVTLSKFATVRSAGRRRVRLQSFPGSALSRARKVPGYRARDRLDRDRDHYSGAHADGDGPSLRRPSFTEG